MLPSVGSAPLRNRSTAVRLESLPSLFQYSGNRAATRQRPKIRGRNSGTIRAGGAGGDIQPALIAPLPPLWRYPLGHPAAPENSGRVTGTALEKILGRHQFSEFEADRRQIGHAKLLSG
jgi:hypothetical protein